MYSNTRRGPKIRSKKKCKIKCSSERNGSERRERSEGRECSPVGVYTISSITRRGSLFNRASEASEDGSERPERSEGRVCSSVGAYNMYSITRRGPKRRRREGRAPKARAWRPFKTYIYVYI